ncbi:hypothetical protein [Asanoa iriomotensis]|uniref:DUF4034 domain-containing protein n=1 Tax=Asanoa iriomotensis TaxID=234613 RepID=A0ABQ4CBD0_9ACTN|nr:hypothetical protein [Asanoa iriomotensis]GIF60058.1 hypothetical protein Air01nite_61530 [Asanoa iriomotensis]
MPALAAPDIDPAAAFPDVRALRDAAKARNWQAVEAGFGRLVDPAVHRLAVSQVGDALDRGLVESVAAANPIDPLSQTLLAWRLVHDGWNIRTGAWGNNVSQEQWKAFHTHLHRAEQILIEVTARHPGYTSAWTERLHTARGLSLGQAEARRRYERLSAGAPGFYAAQDAMVQQLCPKWGGSYEAMHGFAVECVRSAPPGSVNGGMVPAAHIEHWLLLTRDEDDRAGAAYLKRPEVQQELRWAAEQSVFHPAFRPGPDWVDAHSLFAMAFSLAENYQAAAAHFNALLHGGNLASESGWQYLGDAAKEFAAHRERAFQKGFGR